MITPESARPDGLGAVAERGYLTRSEERLDVRTERVVGGWARLEKYLVTETQTITVQLIHEEIRLVREDADPDGSTARGARDGRNSARWMYVNREEVVITKKVVPVERVRLEVYPVAEQRQVNATVRQERITDEPTISAEVPID